MVGWCPAFEPRIGVTFEGDGASIFHEAAALDELAEELGIPMLSSFTDTREPPPDFDGYPEDLIEAIGPWTEWFSPAEGLRCVEGLLAGLEAPSEGLLDDLSALRDVLVVAAKRKNARFRLEVA